MNAVYDNNTCCLTLDKEEMRLIARALAELRITSRLTRRFEDPMQRMYPAILGICQDQAALRVPEDKVEEVVA